MAMATRGVQITTGGSERMRWSRTLAESTARGDTGRDWMSQRFFPSRDTDGAVKSVMDMRKLTARAAAAAGEMGKAANTAIRSLRFRKAKTVRITSIRMPVPAFIIYGALAVSRLSSRPSSALLALWTRTAPSFPLRRASPLGASARAIKVLERSSSTSTRGTRHKRAVSARLGRLPMAARPKW